MKTFFNWMDAFLVSGSLWVYVLIIVGKILEVSIGTLRIVLINRGEKLKGALMAILEMTIWLLIASSVLEGWKDDVLKGVAYVVAFACGSYVGAWLDEFLAFGLSSLQIVVPTLDETKLLVKYLQCQGYGVTSMNVTGKDSSEHYMLIMVIKRKDLKCVLADIKNNCPAAMITVSDVRTIRGGYMRNAKPRGAFMK